MDIVRFWGFEKSQNNFTWKQRTEEFATATTINGTSVIPSHNGLWDK